ncbi:MAG: prohibitin family protein [Firmicutes bacterium]|nr:prohibitin family protein [Bacillota bacterium]
MGFDDFKLEEKINPEDIQKLKGKGKWIFVVVGVILFLTIFRPWVSIDSGHRGVVTHFGDVQTEAVLDEGMHFRIPIYETVHQMNVQVQKEQVDGSAASKDMQTVTTVIALNYRLEPNGTAKLFQEIGLDYDNRVIDPAVQEAVKAVTARYTAEDLIVKRPVVSAEMKELLTSKLVPYHIIVDNFNIVDFRFSKAFEQAIEAKQTAEQQALKAKRDLERVQIEAKQQIERAKAEAEALRIQKQNVTPELVELRRIEAQLKAIEKWDGNLPNVTGGAMPFVDVNKAK